MKSGLSYELRGITQIYLPLPISMVEAEKERSIFDVA